MNRWNRNYESGYGRYYNNYNNGYGRYYNTNYNGTYPYRSYHVPQTYTSSYTPSSRSQKSSSGFGAPRIIFFIVAGGIGFIFLVLFIFNWWVFGRRNKNFTEKMKSEGIRQIKKEFISDNALSSFVLMNSCVINGENCLSVFPLLNDVHLVLEKDTVLGSEVKDRLYYRKNYFEVMMLYYKERSRLRYIPVSNVRKHNIFGMSGFTKSFKQSKKNRYTLLTSAINFVDIVLHQSTFGQADEAFLFCVLSGYYIDIIKYNFIGERFVLDRSYSFYFEKGLASECFSFTVDALSKKLSGQQIDSLIETIDNEDTKVRMYLSEVGNSTHVNIPERT
ncbi:hypothetical protein VCUG_01667 [Vavraia culicis subsp. floridensis]|uniref:Uncharacterized protein n=1 Tax=Vavraia culicis (isolate floridensis) TaxID=948595 RepID=L2GU49_VAVCU|nr:uncharacterized protein VCUG_01667 [Vavraia culicis subsp. floridensis]ELA46823.1 hypothetical protein VCUG_01667 [Vavraia culicis subsp. floridensis]